MLTSHKAIMKPKQNTNSQHIDQKETESVAFNALLKNSVGFKVPDNYFDTLPHIIVDRINQQNAEKTERKRLGWIKAPVVWIPALSLACIACIFTLALHFNRAPQPQKIDELTELNLNYDCSYAEEAVLAESLTIDKELDKDGSQYLLSEAITKDSDPSVQEMTDYLKELDIDPELLSQN